MAPPPQALFLDRDGTIITWKHYLHRPEEVELAEGAAAALRRARSEGCLLFLHTNQSGVGRGYFGREAVDACNARMLELLGMGEDVFEAVCIATERPEQAGPASYRKPSPRFELEQMARRGLDPERCYMVGDRLSDVETGLAAGMGSVLIASAEVDPAAAPDGVAVYASLATFVAERFGAASRGEAS